MFEFQHKCVSANNLDSRGNCLLELKQRSRWRWVDLQHFCISRSTIKSSRHKITFVRRPSHRTLHQEFLCFPVIDNQSWRCFTTRGQSSAKQYEWVNDDFTRRWEELWRPSSFKSRSKIFSGKTHTNKLSDF